MLRPPENRGFRGHSEAKGIAFLTGVYAAQGGGQGRDPDRENSLPPSLPP
jgi:hypothetical protein